MAKITYLWNGKTSATSSVNEFTADYLQGSTSGYVKFASWSEEWTGVNLSYLLSPSQIPTSGTLKSYSYKNNVSGYFFSITDVSLVIPPNITDELLITELTKGTDEWFGDSSSNYFVISPGGDTYRGGGGIDYLYAPALKALYISNKTTINKLVNGNIQINNLGNFNAILDSIERLKFTDVSIAYDLEGNAGKVAKVLGAVFGKSALTNKDYVGIGLSFLDAGMDYKNLLDLALTAKLGQNYTTEAEIKLLYTNVFNLTPGTVTLDILKGLVDSGYCSKSELAYIIAETSNNQINVNLVGLAQSGIEYIPFGS
jgi:hypothetical protein